MTNNLYLFAILKGKTESTRVIKNCFIENDYTRAKLYFKSWINDNENPMEYALFKLGEIQKDNTIKTMKVFIAGGYQVKATETEEYWREKNKELQKVIKKNKENYEKAISATNQAKIIQLLFNGRLINER